MDAAIIRAVNKLWLPAYPGIARQIAEHCTRPPGRILEAGCFSGGIGLMLLQQFPESTLSLALEIEELAGTFASDWEGLIDARRPGRYQILPAPLVFLDRPPRTFDLVIFRGVFFSWMKAAICCQGCTVFFLPAVLFLPEGDTEPTRRLK